MGKGITFGSKKGAFGSILYEDTDWVLERRIDDRRLPWYQITHINTGKPLTEFTSRDIKLISKEVEKDWERLFPERVLG